VSAIECPREPEISEAIGSGFWPGVDESLHEHTRSCEICKDLVALVTLFRQEQADACRQAPIPSARVVWWRAHVRARDEAARTVTQPIAWLNGITTVSVIALAVAVMGAAMRVLTPAWNSVGHLFDFSVPTRSAASGLAAVLDSTIVVWGVGACLLLVPVALYWILADD
jgi:hypothetical protein